MILEPYVPALPASMSIVVSRLLFTPLGPDRPGCGSGGALTDCWNTVLWLSNRLHEPGGPQGPYTCMILEC